MRRFITVAICVLAMLAIASVAQAKPVVPKTPVTTAPKIDGAVFTTVDLNDSNYPNECNNGNPAVNCNQYTAKKYVFMNGGPTHNHLTPDGVYFFAVLSPSGQADPTDGKADNLSDDYDCYLNREVVIQGGEVARALTDPACVTNPAGFATANEPTLAHRTSVGAAGGPFVELAPYADTPNPGGVYMMGVCFVSSNTATTVPIALADPTTISPSLCKYDAFKVQIDTTPPVCRAISTNTGPPKSVTVLVQDSGAGLESVIYSGTNLAADPSDPTKFATSPSPLVVGQTAAFYLIFTKAVQTLGSTFHVDVTDVAGNTTSCDPAFGMGQTLRTATVRAGHRTVLRGLHRDQSKLLLRSASSGVRKAVIAINGRPFAIVALGRGHRISLDLAGALRASSRNAVTVSALGTAGNLYIRISN
jgi:hypothetical protein